MANRYIHKRSGTANVQNYGNAAGFQYNTDDGRVYVNGTGTVLPLQNDLSRGTAYFVDGTSGANTNTGLSWSAAYATISKAISSITSGAGDVIYVRRGTYVENVVITSKTDFAIIAAGPTTANSKRASIAPASGIGLDLAQCDRVFIYGIRTVGVSAVGTRSDSESVLFESCDFTSDTSHGFQFLAATDTNHTGSGSVFNGCLFRECGGAGLRSSVGTGAALGLQATNVNLYNSQFYLNTGDDIDDDAGAGSPTYFNQWDIAGNKFMTRNKAVYLDMDGGTVAECLISGNFFADDAGLDATKIALSTGAVFSGNFQAAGVVNGSAF